MSTPLKLVAFDLDGTLTQHKTPIEPQNRAVLVENAAPVPCDREDILARAAELRYRCGFTHYMGGSVEFHDSGVLTFALLGTEAAPADKLAFDPDRSRRRAVLDQVTAAFPEFNVFVGGSSSFDLAPKPYDKRYALERYCAAHGIALSEAAFCGDDYGPGGNDECVYRAGVRFFKVDDYRRFGETVAELLR